MRAAVSQCLCPGSPVSLGGSGCRSLPTCRWIRIPAEWLAPGPVRARFEGRCWGEILLASKAP